MCTTEVALGADTSENFRKAIPDLRISTTRLSRLNDGGPAALPRKAWACVFSGYVEGRGGGSSKPVKVVDDRGLACICAGPITS